MAAFDPNMGIALRLGEALRYRQLTLPAPLEDISRRADLILAIDKPLLVDTAGVHQWAQFGEHLQEIATTTRSVMPELGQDADRVSVALRLWAGCLMAVKAIAHETLSGPNTPATRTGQFQVIDSIAEQDELFAAGVQAAPAFLEARDQSYRLDGVPPDSQVRRYITGEDAAPAD